jgi:hypothetical protein
LDDKKLGTGCRETVPDNKMLNGVCGKVGAANGDADKAGDV